MTMDISHLLMPSQSLSLDAMGGQLPTMPWEQAAPNRAERRASRDPDTFSDNDPDEDDDEYLDGQAFEDEDDEEEDEDEAGEFEEEPPRRQRREAPDAQALARQVERAALQFLSAARAGDQNAIRNATPEQRALYLEATGTPLPLPGQAPAQARQQQGAPSGTGNGATLGAAPEPLINDREAASFRQYDDLRRLAQTNQQEYNRQLIETPGRQAWVARFIALADDLGLDPNTASGAEMQAALMARRSVAQAQTFQQSAASAPTPEGAYLAFLRDPNAVRFFKNEDWEKVHPSKFASLNPQDAIARMNQVFGALLQRTAGRSRVKDAIDQADRTDRAARATGSRTRRSAPAVIGNTTGNRDSNSVIDQWTRSRRPGGRRNPKLDAAFERELARYGG